MRPVDFINGRSAERDVSIVETKERNGNNRSVQGANGTECVFFFYGRAKAAGKSKEKGGIIQYYGWLISPLR